MRPLPLDDLVLPGGWSVRPATLADLDDLHRVATRHDVAACGFSTTSRASVEAHVAGEGAAARTHAVVTDPTGRVVGWASVHDRAAGRVIVGLSVDPEVGERQADGVGAALYTWAEREGCRLARERGLSRTQLDAGAFAGDARKHRWLAAAGYDHVRTWWQMARTVVPAEGEPGAFPDPQQGVVVRQVVGDDGEPSQGDLRAVHDVLETAFTDHFNYHEESFDEFVERQQQEVGHAWDHWWLVEVEDAEPVGALIGERSAGGAGPDGTYVAYLGVTQAARGRGVATALLRAVIADAASRGRDRVSLEVDADSPTGADRLYAAMGFERRYATESWHRDVPCEA
ncbi:GCN5 family acetyltransferase [Actinotalea ferrariae CF5-4]|uniref:GCN5 family acetyltransferase n=1 Tax=Actinotalea ferrariae CF5-4 TaxID=948458 RepID=A0A021VTW2_9CELL|nr:GNAT family N-acetyltransferase [Actinotalea ferrariae]EYR62507.1 GCN5 family acetyltransferase [Actinotalea ferrariae CF5-4]